MSKSTKNSGRVVGLVLLALGVLFLLQNFTDLDIPWAGWWPVILIVVGVGNLVRKGSSWVGALVLIVLGVLFLLDTQDVWEYTIGDIWRLWPVVLVLIGLKIVFATKSKKKSSGSASHDHFQDHSFPGEVDITSVFGSNQRRIADRALAGGQVTTVFGAAQIDLRDASLAGGQASIEVTAVFGGVEIRLPTNWTVEQNLTNILGGVDDKRDASSSDGSGGVLILTGTCVFAGIELKS